MRLFLLIISLILGGAILFQFPFFGDLKFEDAIFTATSAVCVTGLSTINAQSDLTFPGQILLLFLIQMGAIGIIYISLLLFSALDVKFEIGFQKEISKAFSVKRGAQNFKGILLGITFWAILIEGLGALFFYYILRDGAYQSNAVFMSFFHSVSAFANAGFSLFYNSLEPFKGNEPFLLGTSVLIILGGIGFPVLFELSGLRKGRLSLHSRVVLISTFSLIAVGTGIFHYYEWSHSFTQNFFLSVSARTAGFNTYDLSGLSGASFLFLLFLMFVGASPAGTGGGMKTSTLFLLLFSMFSFLRGERKPHLFQREISSESIFMAQVLFISYVVLVSIGLFVAVIIQPQNHFPEQFKDLSFEVFSAISTTGLSTGYTDKLNTAGKFWFSLLMFLGRLGPVSAIMILAKKKKVIRVSFPKDKVLVG